jgi:D-alanyl-lipoteichoic acid acyltransferase DltB (MBOAT superfamily)
MLFNSFNFLFFLPIVFVLYWHVFQRNLRWQNLFVVVASYVFYGWWDWRFLLLIVFTSLCSYGSGLLIDRCYQRDDKHTAKWWAVLNIVVNLLVLGVFKYFNFFADSFQTVMAAIGITVDAPTLHVILPVGISFYTFQALSYTIDVYRRQLPVTRDVIAFFAFISFFPQLVAGPIERATNLLPQFQNSRTFDYAKAVDGLRQMLWGFFKKLVVADNCAVAVNSIWESYTDQSGLALWIAAFLFTFQIYCDFSGYSDIAIGCARLFGINLRRNFDVPYFSRNIQEFWRRWHMSLMTWFRDYVYFPLGGSRCGKWMTIRNILIVFLLSGLWHGADWTFVLWGLYYGILLSLLLILGSRSKYKDIVADDHWLPSLREVGQMIVTFILVLIGWIIFRAENISQLAGVGVKLFSPEGFFNLYGSGLRADIFVFIGFMLVVEWLQRTKQHALQLPDIKLFHYRFIRVGIYYFLIALMWVTYSSSQQFIYFQF